MARFFSRRDRATTGVRPPERHALPVGNVDTEEACTSYAPGHQMHYIHQGQALRSPSQQASNVIIEGHGVIIVLEDGSQLDYQHHDPDRLSSVLGLFPTSRVAYPEFHALRVGPYWFNCARDAFEPCRPDIEDSGS
ncbi:MAG: hypothetical protein ACXWDI_09000 [Nocardioides sp.]